MSNEPLITIGITSFNSEGNILRALNSAINQTWQNKEIIVVDDFSSDNTVKIIENYINNFDIFKFYKQITIEFLRNLFRIRCFSSF